jgi:hypothetical protein
MTYDKKYRTVYFEYEYSTVMQIHVNIHYTLMLHAINATTRNLQRTRLTDVNSNGKPCILTPMGAGGGGGRCQITS